MRTFYQPLGRGCLLQLVIVSVILRRQPLIEPIANGWAEDL
ncbi:MAG: hypothetical protein R3Y10_08725 [Ferrimonas sp.]